MHEFKLRGTITDSIDIDANKELGFNFPFKIIIPKNLNDNPDLVYACNLPRNETSNCQTFEELIEYARNDFGSIDPMLIHLCLEKGNPMVVPAIPRFDEFRPNFLGRDCFKNDFKRLEKSRFKEHLYKYENLADQHKAMIKHAINCLREMQISVGDKVIISGYSEGAKFASHLALLRPEIIKAVIAGGTGGVMSMPVTNVDGYEFVYPTGISDVLDFDFKSFKEIAFFYYMGDKDKSDSAIPNFETAYYVDNDGNKCILKDECGNLAPQIDANGEPIFLLDDNGNYTAKFSLFSDDEVNAINKSLGTKTQDRFIKQKEIYESKGLNSIFKMYPGNHRTIFDNSDELFKDVDFFIANYLKHDTKQKLR